MIQPSEPSPYNEAPPSYDAAVAPTQPLLTAPRAPVPQAKVVRQVSTVTSYKTQVTQFNQLRQQFHCFINKGVF